MNKQELLDGLRGLAAIKAEERPVSMSCIIDILTLIEKSDGGPTVKEEVDPHSAEKIMAVPRLVDILNRLRWGKSASILEAAEKIPAQQVLFALDNIATPNASSQNVVYNGLIEFVRTLLESLPDPEKEPGK